MFHKRCFHCIHITAFLVLLSFFPFYAIAQSIDKAREIIADLDSIVTPNGVQENYQVKLGNEKQWVFVRGKDKRNPILLFIHGGPASPMAPIAWTFQRPLEEYFTVVHYDQRGSGKTFARADTLDLGKTIRIENYVEDALALSDFILHRYGQKKLILMGHSWGTIVALKAALRRPDLFSAYIGIGQVIYTRDNERLSYDYGMEQAKSHHNQKAINQLRTIAPYPGDIPITRERIIIARTWPQYYGGLSAYRNQSMQFFRAPLLSSVYENLDIEAIDKGSIFTLSKLLPEFLNVDLRENTVVEIPVFMFMGRHDYTTPTAPVTRWFRKLKAPYKKEVWFEHSAHLLPLEEPGKFLLSLHNEVLPHINPHR